MYIGVVLFALAVLVPPQAVEYFRFLLTDISSDAERIIRLLGPALLLSLVAGTTLFVSRSAALINDDTPLHQAVRLELLLVSVAPLLCEWITLYVAHETLSATEQERVATAYRASALSLLGALFAVVLLIAALPMNRPARNRWRRLAVGLNWTLGAALAAFFVFEILSPLYDKDLPIAVALFVSPLGILSLFCSLLVVIVNELSRYSLFRIPADVALVLVAFVFNLGGINNNHEIRALQQEGRRLVGGRETFLDTYMLRRWYDTRPDFKNFKDRPYPLFLVAVQGGGIFAGYHVASVLAHLEDRAPGFANHVFAISGVSGGGLGAALFAGLVKHRGALVQARCFPSSSKAYAEMVDSYFSYDFLSPVLFAGLGPDFFQRFVPLRVPSYDRARFLEYAFERAWDAMTAECRHPVPNPFRDSITSWTLRDPAPALFLNATVVESGRPITIAPLRSGDLLFTSIWDMGLNHAMRVSTAVGVSSRFPFITPAGWFKGAELDLSGDVREITVSLADGGYYDNSGTDLLLNLLLITKEAAKRLQTKVNLEINVIVIGDLSAVSDEYISNWQTTLAD